MAWRASNWMSRTRNDENNDDDDDDDDDGDDDDDDDDDGDGVNQFILVHTMSITIAMCSAALAPFSAMRALELDSKAWMSRLARSLQMP